METMFAGGITAAADLTSTAAGLLATELDGVDDDHPLRAKIGSLLRDAQWLARDLLALGEATEVAELLAAD